MNKIKIAGVTVNLNRMTNSVTASEMREALEGDATRLAFHNLLADQADGIRTINVIEKSGSRDSASSTLFKTYVNIEWNSSKVAGGEYSVASVFAHELAHSTKDVNRAGEILANDFKVNNPDAYQAIVDAAGGTGLADQALRYAYEERLVISISDGIRISLSEPEKWHDGWTFGHVVGHHLSNPKNLNLSPVDRDALIDSINAFQVDYLFDEAARVVRLDIPDYFFDPGYRIDSVSDILGLVDALENGSSHKDDGSVDFWRAADGDVGRTLENSRYSDRFLDNYGVVDGTVAKATFGGHLRAFADWLGFDRKPGLDGSFSRKDEGNIGFRTGEDSADYGIGISKRPKSRSEAEGEGGGWSSGSGSVESNGWSTHDDRPIVLDLNANGIEIDELWQSTVFTDSSDDGLQHRTAWAAAGDGVLFYDADGDGKISEKREYIFTEWDPTASSDIEALKSYFDTNDDGVFNATDTFWSDFKVLVTQSDGSLQSQTLNQLGIVSIDLVTDTTNFQFTDGSEITGQTTFTRNDNSVGTVADVTLVAETESFRVDSQETFDQNNARTYVQTGFNSDGSIAFVNTSVSAADGSDNKRYFDVDGDGVVDRVQSILRVTAADGSTVETFENYLGSDTSNAVLSDAVRTTRNVDGSSVVIERDTLGGGWYQQRETQAQDASGSSVLLEHLSQNGTVVRSTFETVSNDGLLRTQSIDEDGDGAADLTVTQDITIDADQSRSEQTSELNADGSIRRKLTENVSSDGRSKTIQSDLDGDGIFDAEQVLSISVTDGETNSVLETLNGDGSLNRRVEQFQSDDALHKERKEDLDGDGDFDIETIEITTIDIDGGRTKSTEVKNTDASLRSSTKAFLAADSITSQTWIDLDRDGIFDSSELVSSVAIEAITQERIATTWDRNFDGSINGFLTTTTSENGLQSNTRVFDLDDADQSILTDHVQDTTIQLNATYSQRTVQTFNTVDTSSLRSSEQILTRNDGLEVIVLQDMDGDGLFDLERTSLTENINDGSVRFTNTETSGNGQQLLSETIRDESNDRRIITERVDDDGDGIIDTKSTRTEAVDGASVSTDELFALNGSLVGRTTESVSADGLTRTRQVDANGDGTNDSVFNSVTTLNQNGSRVEAIETRNQDGSLRQKEAVWTSDDGLVVETTSDLDGNGSSERVSRLETEYLADGSMIVTSSSFAFDGVTRSTLSEVRNSVSDDGLIETTESDRDGDGNYDLIDTSTSVLQDDGSIIVSNEMHDSSGYLRSASQVESSDDLRLVTRRVDENGDGIFEQVSETSISDNGVQTTIDSSIASDGNLQFETVRVVSADQRETLVNEDRDGDGRVDVVTSSKTDILTDGTRKEVFRNMTANDATVSKTVTYVSDDGLEIKVDSDFDGDGTFDLRELTVKQYDQNGDILDTTETNSSDGSSIMVSTIHQDASAAKVTTTHDYNGDGTAEKITETFENSSGTQISFSTVLDGSASQNVVALERTEVSNDGLSSYYATDRDADGLVELEISDTANLLMDGYVSRTVTAKSATGLDNTSNPILQKIGEAVYVTSDDEHSESASFDFDGDGEIDFSSDVASTYLLNGNLSTVSETKNSNGELLSKRTVVVSGNTLTIETNTDLNGDGLDDFIESRIDDASGGYIRSLQYFDIFETKLWQSTTIQSANGRLNTTSIDQDGDGLNDRSVSSETTIDNGLELQLSDLDSNEVQSALFSSLSIANGMQLIRNYDFDADGSAEIVMTVETTYKSDGSRTDIATETYGQYVNFVQTTTTSANGLNITNETDHNGDGVADSSERTVETLNADGSRTISTETLLSNGVWQVQSTLSTSANGLTEILSIDKDDDGQDDTVVSIETGFDGSQTETTQTFQEDGSLENSEVVHTSADGREMTILRNGVEQTVTYNALGNGSYEWENGSAAAEIVRVAHLVDHIGIETWTIFEAGSETASVKLDQQSKQRVLDEAARLYDTILDRDLDLSESEILVQFVSGHQLDGSDLAKHLLTSEEFGTRYGSLNDANFIIHLFKNAYGRGPSLVELNSHLVELTDGGIKREDLAVRLSESSEHLFAGNSHMSSNNDQLFLSGAEFDHDLDGQSVSQSISYLYKILGSEIPNVAAFSTISALLESSNLSDIADILVTSNSHLYGQSTVSLHGFLAGIEEPLTPNVQPTGSGYSGTPVFLNSDGYYDLVSNLDSSNYNSPTLNGAISNYTPSTVLYSVQTDIKGFVEQAFQNGLGRLPNTAELLVWSDHLMYGRLSAGEFLVALSQSNEFLSAQENQNGAGTAPQSNTIEVEDRTSSDINLNAENASSVQGDDRNNDLTASGHFVSVTINGDDGDDTVIGGSQNDILAGGNGADALYGNDGDDVISIDADDVSTQGGEGYDVAIVENEDAVSLDLVATGFESAVGNNGNDIFTAEGSNISVALFGGAGDDTLSGGNTADTFFGSIGDDSIFGGAGQDTANGGNGNDRIDGETGDDSLLGGSGDDTIIGGIGDDTLAGGEGDDSINGDTEDDVLVGGKGNDTLIGGAGDDSLSGGAGNDILIDDNGDDRVTGGDGDDIFQLSRNDEALSYDVVIGGKGNDILELSGVASEWTIFDKTGTQFALSHHAANGGHYIDVIGVEVVQFSDGNQIGLAGVDSSQDEVDILSRSSPTIVTANGQRAWGLSGGTYWAGAGDDVFESRYSEQYWTDEAFETRSWTLADNSEVFIGGSGNDHIQGGAYEDTIYGGSGSDQLHGQDGYDSLFGGSGNDYLNGGNHHDQLFGESGDDVLDGSLGNDWLYGEFGKDVLTGGIGYDHLYGGDGSDTLSGGDHTDVLYGDGGADEIYGDGGDDILYGGLYHDLLWGGEGNDSLEGGYGNDSLSGNSGNDTIRGEQGVDILFGGAGNDILDGGYGDDYIDGEDGADFLVGGGGSDTLQGGAGADTIDGGEGVLDLVVYRTSTSAVTVDLSDGTASGGHAEGDVFVAAAGTTNLAIEGVIGSEHDDALTGDGRRNVLYGEDGNDVLDGGADEDLLSGGDGNDNLIGSWGMDTLIGGAGNDTLEAGENGGAGQQELFGGDGDDYYKIIKKGGTHLIHEDLDQGIDTVEFAWMPFDNDISVTTESTQLVISWVHNGVNSEVRFNDFGQHIDSFKFSDGTEVSSFVLGNAEIESWIVADGETSGTVQNDVFWVDDAGVTITENANAGSDLVLSSVTFKLFEHSSHIENIGLTGSTNINGSGNYLDNIVQGNIGDNYLGGRSGNDTLDGLSGADTLYGGLGDDTLVGGQGNDTFVFSAVENEGMDVIQDYEDGFDLVQIDGTGLAFDDLTIVEEDGFLKVSYGDLGAQIWIANSNSEQIEANDFLFEV
ncbi:MAG: DUF4214 domain-containing protein [Paracoccaceae bacterium]